MASVSTTYQTIAALVQRVTRTDHGADEDTTCDELDEVCEVLKDVNHADLADAEVKGLLEAAISGGMLATLARHLKSGSASVIVSAYTIIHRWPGMIGLAAAMVKEHPNLLPSLISYLDSRSEQLAVHAAMAIATLASCISGGRAAVEAGAVPKLTKLLKSGSRASKGAAAMAINTMTETSGTRAVTAAKAGAAGAVATMVCIECSTREEAVCSATAADAFHQILRQLPAEHMPAGAELQLVISALLREMRAGGRHACNAIFTCSTLLNRVQQQQQDPLARSMARANMALPLLKLLQASGAPASSSTTSGNAASTSTSTSTSASANNSASASTSTSTSTSTGTCCLASSSTFNNHASPEFQEGIRPLAMSVLSAVVEYSHHLLEVLLRAGLLQLVLKQLKQEPSAMGDACTHIIGLLMLHRPELAQQVASACVVPELIQVANTAQDAVMDVRVLFCLSESSDGALLAPWAQEVLAAGIMPLLLRSLVRQQHRDISFESMQLNTAELAQSLVMGLAAGRPGGQLAAEHVAQCTPLVQQLVRLGQQPGVAAEVQQEAVRAVELFAAASGELAQLAAAAAQGAAGSSGDVERLQVEAADALAVPQPAVCAQCGSGSRRDGKSKPLLQCSACLGVRYCSAECQKVHWKRVHRKECVKRV